MLSCPRCMASSPRHPQPLPPEDETLLLQQGVNNETEEKSTHISFRQIRGRTRVHRKVCNGRQEEKRPIKYTPRTFQGAVYTFSPQTQVLYPNGDLQTFAHWSCKCQSQAEAPWQPLTLHLGGRVLVPTPGPGHTDILLFLGNNPATLRGGFA